jgi:hypothetical protein
MLPRVDIIEAETLCAEESAVEGNGGTDVFCQRCQKLISNSRDESTPEICVACSRDLTLQQERIDQNRIVKTLPKSIQGFREAASGILGELRDMSCIDENDVEFEIRSTKMWRSIGALTSFLHCSEEHNELIAALQQVACSEVCRDFTMQKASVLRNVFEMLHSNPVLSNPVLDKAYLILQEAHLDTNHWTSFLKDTGHATGVS